MDALPDWLEQLARMPAEEAREAVGRMGAEKTPESAARLRLIEEAGPPALRKEARRALYRLRAAGVEVPPPRTAPPAAGPTRALISWVDGRGDLMVVALVDRPSGGARYVRLLVGDGGIGEAEVSELSPGQLRRLRRDLETKLRMVECPVAHAQRLVAEAAARGLPEEPAQRAVAEAALRTLGQPPAEVPHPAHQVMDARAIRWDPDLLPETPRLLEVEEMAGWVLPPDQMEPWVKQYDGMASSHLIVDPFHQRARYQNLLREAARALFPPESLPSWRRRLEDMAYYFHRCQKLRPARLALSAALALGEDAGEHPFFLALVEKSLLEARRKADRPEGGGRIIVPGR